MTLADFIRDRAKETYEEKITDGHLAITHAMLPQVCEHVPKGGLVLDVGCGQGPALEWFRANGYEAIGTTTNNEDYNACEERDYTVHFSDMHDVGGLMGSIQVDLIWARHVLEHSIAPFYVLHEFARILKPGGILYVEVPSPLTPCNHWNNLNHYSVLTEDMWLSLIHRAGFEVIRGCNIDLTTGEGPDIYHCWVCKRL